MKVTLCLKGRTDSFGRKTVAIRINQGDVRKFRNTDIKVKPSEFDGKIKPVHPDHAQLNRKLLNMILEVERNNGFTDEKKSDLTFYDYSIKLLNEWDKQKHWDTLRHYRSSLEKFNNFSPNILLSNVTAETLKGFHSYCYALGNKQNTVWTSFKFVRVIIFRAIKEGKLTVNPFNLFEMPKYKDPKRLFLTDKQIEAIKKIKNLPAELEFVRTWFLIGCYTGLRFGDMQRFGAKKNVKNNRLIVYTSKTNEVVGMPLNKELKALFQRIDYRPLGVTNEYFNRMLKQIQELTGIEDKLTAHISRHTFAVMCANKGISQEVTSKLLGHNSIRTTAIYYKITNERIDKELSKIFK